MTTQIRFRCTGCGQETDGIPICCTPETEYEIVRYVSDPPTDPSPAIESPTVSFDSSTTRFAVAGSSWRGYLVEVQAADPVWAIVKVYTGPKRDIGKEFRVRVSNLRPVQ